MSNAEVRQLQSRLARYEGTFCETAAAVAIEGALKAIDADEID